MKPIVIKIGTNLLTDHHQRLDLNNMRHIVYQLADSLNSQEKHEFIIVSSGAITSGAKHINISPENLAEKQAAASIGQILLFQKYYEFFQAKGLCVGQLLLTKDNFNDSHKKENIKQTIETLLKNNVIPIINENDSVSTEEIQFGDNDQLAATLAVHLNCDKFILLTNTDGVLDRNQQVIPTLTKITENEFKLVNDKMSSIYSKGGMRSKLMAAKTACEAGINVTIANGRAENVIKSILANKSTGTTIAKELR